MSKIGRVLLLASHSSIGGTSQYMQLLAGLLGEMGHEVQMVALGRAKHCSDEKISVLGEPFGIGATGFGLFAWLHYIWMCLRWRPDLILGVMPKANLAAALGALFARGRAIATHHSPVVHHHPLLRWIDQRIGALGMYERVVCVSAPVEDSVASYPLEYRKKLTLIANGIQPIDRSKVDRDAVRRRLDIEAGWCAVAMVGRISEEKNVLRVIKAVSDLDNVALLLAGDGPLRAEAESLCSRLGVDARVRFLGNLQPKEVAEVLIACDVFVQVSHFEGHSFALMEAVSAHCPLVVSSIPPQIAATRLPDGSSAALLCESHSVDSIRLSIAKAAFEGRTRDHLQQQVRALANNLRGLDNMLSDYRGLFEKVICGGVAD